MPTKIVVLEITYCRECPHNHLRTKSGVMEGYVCLLKNGKLITPASEVRTDKVVWYNFPSWCPLENKDR